MMYIWALLIGSLFGICGLGPGGFFVTLFVIWLGHTLKKYEQVADRWVARQSDYQQQLDEQYEWLRLEAEQEAQLERRARRARLQNAEDAVFRVIHEVPVKHTD